MTSPSLHATAVRCMIDVTIPGFGHLELSELVCDFNGTLARDGMLIDGVRDRLVQVSRHVNVRVVTADTFGTARAQLNGCACELEVLEPDDQAIAKAAVVERLGASRVVAIGNGRNDRLMLASAALGIAVLGDEGLAGDAAGSGTIVTRHIADALGLLLEPRRIVATLRD